MNHNFTKRQLLNEMKKICLSLDKIKDISIGGNCSNFDSILDELKSQEDSIIRINLNTKKKANHKLDFYFMCFDLYLNLIGNLFFFCQDSILKADYMISWKFSENNPKYRNPSAVVLLIKATQMNYLVGIKNLIIAGLDYQAIVLIRSFIEMNDLLIAMISNEEFCKKYCFIYDDGKGGIDYSYVQKLYNSYSSPSKLRGYFDEALKDTVADNNFIDIIKPLRKSYYFDELSTYIHPEPLSLAAGIMPFNERTDEVEYNIFGGYSPMSKVILNKLLFFGFTNLLVEIDLLKKKHKVTNERRNDYSWDTINYKFTILDEIVCKYILPNMVSEQ